MLDQQRKVQLKCGAFETFTGAIPCCGLAH